MLAKKTILKIILPCFTEAKQNQIQSPVSLPMLIFQIKMIINADRNEKLFLENGSSPVHSAPDEEKHPDINYFELPRGELTHTGLRQFMETV